MKLYLASRYDRREEMLKYAAELERDGHTITSRWIQGHEVPEELPVEESLRLHQQYAQDDLDDIDTADILILFSDPPGVCVRGGKHVETGYAVAVGKKVIVVGRRENIFHHLPWIEFFETFSLARVWLSSVDENPFSD